MPQTFHKELSRLARSKKIISLLPSRVRFRAAKALYDYQSPKVNGIDLIVPLQNDGLVCLVNTKDLIGWKIYFFGEYEPDTNRVLTHHLKNDFVVIEAGANMGSETLLISRLLTKGKVYAFEPNPFTFERLKMNIAINRLENVIASDVALGETNNQIKFNIFPKNFCNSGMSSKYMETSDSIKIDVVQQTLDAYIKENNIDKVDFIKMDIQGAEMDMLAGSAETIATFKPAIFTEACEPYNDTKELYNMLKKYGYDIYLIGADKMDVIPTTDKVQDGNWLALCSK